MFENYPDIVSIKDMMKMLCVGKSSAYSLLKNNQIPHMLIGAYRKKIYCTKAINSWLYR